MINSRNSLVAALLALGLLLTTTGAQQPGAGHRSAAPRPAVQPHPTVRPSSLGSSPTTSTTTTSPRSTTESPGRSTKPKETKGVDDTFWLLLAALVAVLAGLGVLLLPGRPAQVLAGVRHRDAPRTAGPVNPDMAEIRFPYRKTVIPDGPRRTAVVCTELHPQGYVELDGCLQRAVWADPALPPPEPGGLTDVIKGRDAELWLAVPSTHRRGGPRNR